MSLTLRLAMRAFAVAVAVLAVMAVPLGCDDESEGAASATVNGQKIERGDVDSLIALYRRRSEAEGEDEGGEPEKVGHAQELATLQVLVQRAVVEQKAKQLGIRLGRDEVERRARALGGGESDAKDREGIENEAELEKQFRDTARAQLINEALYRRVTRNVRVSDAKVLAYYRSHRLLFRSRDARRRPSQMEEQSIRRGLMAIERDRAMARWLKRVRREAEPEISYAQGWVPRTS